DPFAHISRTVLELDTARFGGRQQGDGLAVDQQQLRHIEGYYAGFLLEHVSQHGDVVRGNAAADAQDHTIVSSQDSVDSAGHGCASPFRNNGRQWRDRRRARAAQSVRHATVPGNQEGNGGEREKRIVNMVNWVNLAEVATSTRRVRAAS